MSPPLQLSAAAAAAACVVAMGLVACGSGSADPTVARVGPATITRAALGEWMTALAPEHAAPDPPRYANCIRREQQLAIGPPKGSLVGACEREYDALRRRALSSLISARWLIETARDRGLAPSSREVRIAAATSSLSRELQEAGADVARAQAVVQLQARASLSREAVRNALFAHEAPIARREVAERYSREISSYRVPERRYFEIFEHIPNRPAAVAAMRRVAAGHRGVPATHLHEWLDRSHRVSPEQRAIVAAIFAARRHVLTGPIPLAGSWAFIEITKIAAARTRPLSAAESSIRRRLERERQDEKLASFIARWRREWIAKTQCSVGYVVQKCGNYRGRRSPEAPLSMQ